MPSRTAAGRKSLVQRSYRLTQKLIAEHAAGQVLCLSARAEGLSYRLHERRPGPELNATIRADGLPEPPPVLDAEPENEPVSFVTRVDIRGPIEQRAVEHGSNGCGGGWTDGHDAIADRMCAALELGDVVMVIDSPGGAHAGLQEAIKRVLAEKAEHGRHVCVFADELIGSAAYWWAAVVGDEIYVPESGMVGSIGARAAHCSIAGALEQAGVAVTFFAWPGPGKIAWAEEKPLDDIGRERGQRDTDIAGQAFGMAVSAARGIPLDQIMALQADSLTGSAAVSAGLADGVASLDEVLGFALAQAAVSGVSGEGNEMATRADSSYERKTTEKYETDDNAPPPPPAPPSSDPGKDKPEKADDDDDDDEEEDDKKADDVASDDKRAEDDDDSEEPDGGDEPDKEKPEKADRRSDDRMEDKRAAPPPSRMRADASLAEVVGVPKGSSDLAVKTAALRMRATLDACMRETGTKGLDALVGAVKAVTADSRRVSEVEERNAKMLRRSRFERRMVLARKLVAANLPGCTRGELFIDAVDEKSGKRRTKLAPEYQQMRLETFEAFVERKLKNAGPTRARTQTPFEPNAKQAQQGPRAALVEAAKQNPVVIAAAQRTDASLDQCAEAYVAAGLQGKNLIPDTMGH